ncbi:MAG: hypothetical protein ACRDNO_13905, partial [Trebonia sp.]
MTEESREPGSVAGTQAEPEGPAPASGGPAVAEPAPLVPGARQPEVAGDVPAAGEAPELAGDAPPVAGDAPPASGDVHTVAGTGEAVDDDEQAEIVRLRAEVRELRSREGETAPRKARPAGGRWRAPVAVVAITLACVLAMVSVVAVWGATQVSNTDRFVANMEPLIHEVPIQNALSAEITSQITSRVDVGALTATAAGELASAHLPALSRLVTQFEGPLSSGVNSLVGTAVSRFVASPAMATLWAAALRNVHTGLVKVLSGQGNGTLDVVNGQVVLSLGPIITQVKDYLVTHGVGFASSIPAVNPTFPLFEAPNLAKAQSGYRLLLTLRWLLPLLAVALFVAGIWIARGHRHALLGAALGLSAAMLVLAAALTIARGIYLNSVPQNVLPSDAAAAAYDTLVRFIKDGLRLLLVVGLVVAIGAFFTGPATAAVRTRRAVASGIGWLRAYGERAGLRTGPAGDWTATHKTLLRVAALGLVALIFVFWGQPSVAVVIWLVVLLLVLLGVI